jgi:4-amino-4-deoxy-L-arabinose transferase-like glycosyltransferase
VRSALTHLVRVLTAALLGYDLWRFLDTARAYLGSPYSRDYGEGCVLAMVQLLAERGSYFPHMRDYPFVHGNYPPVFIALNWPFYALFGPSLLAPRALSLIATGGLMAVLFLLLRRLGRDRVASAFLACALLAPWFVESWAALGRVDMLACFFSVLGLLLWERDREQPSPYRALALFWLAFFTKQNALLAPAAVLADLFLEDRRAFRRALLAFALPLLALFGALVLVTGAEAWRHLVTYTAAAEYEWPRMLESYREFLLVTWPAQALIVAALAFATRGVLAGTGRVFVLYWLLNLVGLATIAKAGAAQNYFIEPWLATLLLTGVALRELAARFPATASLPSSCVLVVVLVASLVRGEARRLPQAIRSPDRARDFIALTQAIRETDGPILSENLSILVVNRRPVLVEPFGLLQLSRRGYLQPDRVVRDCERGFFSLVVTEHRLGEVAGLGECLDRRYYAWKELGPYQVLRPR